MTEFLQTILVQQFLAVHAMFTDCIEKCPPEHWDDLVAKYPFWLVAYHTLYCTDGYLAFPEEAFEYHPVFHPAGAADINAEYPSKRFTKEELLAYAQFIKEKIERVLMAETPEVLAGDSGCKRRNMSRAELHIYNLRHIAHHTGQLSAVLRRIGLDPKWVSRGRTP